MKTKVNAKWYNQTVKHLKNGIAQEKMQLRRQFYRYRDAKNGKKQAFDIEHDISIEKLFQYLDDAIHQVGHAEKSLKNIVDNYEPDSSLKIDWKGIETEIKNFAAKNNGILCTSDDEYLEFVGDFFCEAKFAVPDTQKNNDQLYRLLNKYQCCDDDLYDNYEPEGFEQ